MSDVPKWESFRTRKVPTSDPEVADSQISQEGETIAVRICRVCKQPFSEGQSFVICSRCGHYVHESCQANYEMAPTDFLCIVEATGIDRRKFKVLYALLNGHGDRKIRKAGRFPHSDLKRFKAELVGAGFLLTGKFLVFARTHPTFCADEIFPALNKIYGQDEDFKTFTERLTAKP